MAHSTEAQPVTERRPYFSLRDLSQIAVAGVGAALIDLVVKRSLGIALRGVPFSGSLVAALPRTLLVLLVACRIRKPGVIALVSAVEGGLNFASGGSFPMPLLSPVGAGLAGETVWLSVGALKSHPMVRLVSTGAVLAAGRLAMASGIALVLGTPLTRWFSAAPWLVTAMFSVNIVLGGVAGALSRRFLNELQTLGLAADEKPSIE